MIKAFIKGMLEGMYYVFLGALGGLLTLFVIGAIDKIHNK